jgi:hypothetical protein
LLKAAWITFAGVGLQVLLIQFAAAGSAATALVTQSAEPGCHALQVFFIVGEFALVIIAVALPSWRGQFAAGAVLCAGSLLLWPLLPESGRWLYVQGRTDEAMEVSRGVRCVPFQLHVGDAALCERPWCATATDLT